MNSLITRHSRAKCFLKLVSIVYNVLQTLLNIQLENKHKRGFIGITKVITKALPIWCRFVAMNVMRLKRQGVTHILNAAEGNSFMHVNTNAEFYAGTGIIYHGIPASDTDHFDISVFFEEAADFIEKALSYKNGKGQRIIQLKLFVFCVSNVGFAIQVTVINTVMLFASAVIQNQMKLLKVDRQLNLYQLYLWEQMKSLTVHSAYDMLNSLVFLSGLSDDKPPKRKNS